MNEKNRYDIGFFCFLIPIVPRPYLQMPQHIPNGQNLRHVAPETYSPESDSGRMVRWVEKEWGVGLSGEEGVRGC